MRRLQTIIVVLSLFATFACGTNRVEEPVSPTEIAVEQSAPVEVSEEPVCDTTEVNANDPTLSAPIEEVAKIDDEKRSIPVKHLMWLLIPAVAVAALGFVCRVKISKVKENSEKEMRLVKWLVGSVLALYVVEFIMLAILLLLGVLEACEPKLVVVVVLFSLLLMSLNAYGAFATNSAILSRYEISFTWKRVLVYVGIALAVEAFFALLIPRIFDVAITDARMFVPNLIILAITLFVLFGIDMYKQNEQSLRAIPVVFILFMIGMLMVGVLAVIALLAIGLWSVIKSCLAKDVAKEETKNVVEEPVEEQTAEPAQLSEEVEEVEEIKEDVE